MIEKVEFCSAEIIVNWCSPIRLLSIQNQVEKWLEIPHFCCYFVATFTIFGKWWLCSRYQKILGSETGGDFTGFYFFGRILKIYQPLLVIS